MMNFFSKNMSLVFITFFMFFNANIASSSTFPRGCEVSGYGYQQNFLTLNEKGNPSLFLIENHSKDAIELELFETNDELMSPKLHSKLDQGRWAAFASDVKSQHFKCFTQQGDTTNIINCSEVLDVCQYPRVKFALSNMGSYWVSTNKEQGQVIHDAAAKGIFLHW